MLSAHVGSYTEILTTNGRRLWLGVKVLKLCFSGSLPNFNLIAGYPIIADWPAPGKYVERGPTSWILQYVSRVLCNRTEPAI